LPDSGAEHDNECPDTGQVFDSILPVKVAISSGAPALFGNTICKAPFHWTDGVNIRYFFPDPQRHAITGSNVVTPAVRNMDNSARSDADLDAAVAARPKNLTAHLQRITHHLETRDQDATYGALLDLFRILGDKGHDLRSRLTHRAFRLLSADQYNALQDSLTGRVAGQDHWPDSARCVLIEPDLGQTRPLAASDDDGESTIAVAVSLASEYTRRGWHDLAEHLLREHEGNPIADKALSDLRSSTR